MDDQKTEKKIKTSIRFSPGELSIEADDPGVVEQALQSHDFSNKLEADLKVKITSQNNRDVIVGLITFTLVVATVASLTSSLSSNHCKPQVTTNVRYYLHS